MAETQCGSVHESPTLPCLAWQGRARHLIAGIYGSAIACERFPVRAESCGRRPAASAVRWVPHLRRLEHGAHRREENKVQDLIRWSESAASELRRRIETWLVELLQRLSGSEAEAELLSAPEPRPTASVVPKSELAQFPGLVFHTNGANFDHRAEVNDAAIRASLIWFKHRWPGALAEIDGSEAFRRRAWEIADEVGVPVKGPRPARGEVAWRPWGWPC
jgi:Large polyvalent protein-associated domain 7